MEPNTLFDDNTTQEFNGTEVEENFTANEVEETKLIEELGPRIINLSMTRIAALTAIGKSNQEIANIYGVKTKDIAQAKVAFGMYKTRKSRDGAAKVPSYITTLDFDMEM